MVLIAVLVLGVLSLVHFVKNRDRYDLGSRALLPVFYAISLGLLFLTGFVSLLHIVPYLMITIIKCGILEEHVRKIVWDFSPKMIRDHPRIYILHNDLLALVFVLGARLLKDTLG